MAEQTFRSPGFFEREIDLSARQQAPTGTPAGIIGTAEKGPAFVPVTVGSFADFETKFGTLDPDRSGPYAAREYLKNKDAVTYLRVLGAGSNESTTDMTNTTTYGIVKNAGFKVASVAADVANAPYRGSVSFLSAKHYVSASEAVAFPVFSDNASINTATSPNLVRAVLFFTTASRGVVLDHNQAVTATNVNTSDNLATVSDSSNFKFVVSSSEGSVFSNDDGVAGVRVYSASLNPYSNNYIGKILNTDPRKFQELNHYLYLDFAVEDELASVDLGANSIALLSGSSTTNTVGLSDTWRNSFGRFDTRFTTPQTTEFISQPYGKVEFDLFHFEALSDGAYANDKVKISIANIRASTDPNYDYGTFEVQVRRFDDTDTNPAILEAFPALTLDPNSEKYIGRIIGDYAARFNFDSTDEDERRIVISGKYPNRSAFVRVVINYSIERGEVPADALPFGFRGVPVLKTTNSMTDLGHAALSFDGKTYGQPSSIRTSVGGASNLTSSIVPPLPFRFKVTRGETNTSPYFTGQPGKNERVDARLYWGTKFETLPLTSSTENAIYNPNSSDMLNPLLAAYSKFQGILKLDNLVTGSGADAFNNNKFTLAKVAFFNTETNLSTLTGSAAEHMKDAAYVRNGAPDAVNYTVNDGTLSGRITLATLVHSSSVKFNRFTDYAKFTAPMYGGFDGVNLLDKDNLLLTDKASSTDAGGKAAATYTGGLGLTGTNNGAMSGAGRLNNIIHSYRTAVDIMTDPMTVSTNLLAIPGIRDTYITDYAAVSNRDYSMAMYLMDIQHYDEDGNRLYTDSAAKRDVRTTVEQFEGRQVDNNYTATYFPDVYINDEVNNRPVKVPSSVAALGALGYSDKVSYPWFAPAGFNRGAMDFVRNSEVRLTSADRDNLYDARINPIANFPNGGYVIFGQKTLQMTKSALDRVNVRRMLLEVKRLVVQVANNLLFEPNNAATRARFIGQVTPILALVQSQAGIEKFKVIMDDTNNTQSDVEQNKLNGRIVLVPTRAVEFISIDFIITNSGVIFA